jgi:BrnA antitoxin of type II toxin-antitoxin system
MIEKRRATASDLKRIDEHVLGTRDYDEIPEQTDADFIRGVWHRGGKPLPHGPRGRPKSKNPKRPVSIRLDPDVLAHFRRTGRGWQGRINAALRKVAKLPQKKRKRA